jgi:hypothetical protein
MRMTDQYRDCRNTHWRLHPRPRPVLAWLGLASALVTAQGCATGWHVDTVADPAFTPDEVRAVAVLPWFDWDLSLDEAREAAERVVAALEHSRRNLRIVAPAAASDAIAAAGLAYEWGLFLYDRREGTAVDSTVVMRIGDAVGADLLAQITLVDVFQHDGSEELGTAYTSVLVQVELLDARTGRLAWTGSSGIDWADDLQRAPPVRQPMRWALDAVLEAMPRLGSRSAP